MHSWDKLWTTDAKRPPHPDSKIKSQVLLLKSQETKQDVRSKSRAGPLHMTPPKGWADHLSHPSAQPLDTPLPHMRKQPSPPQGESKVSCYLFSLLPSATGTPIKICLNFLPGLLSISIDWGRPRTLVNITQFLHTSCIFSIVISGVRRSVWL